eukprot:gb/GFBE01036446.1/.p1 GENE.gb/GFBE01036446.1/~~gb/GFBE01036446.1/.p1  ORF type:complete len:163 (+),score=66.98 gb/GFBE01036446.1/:1-489(+)
MSIPEEEVQEVFKLFDQDGGGIKIKEIGTVMRSLGLAASEAQLRDFMAEATKKDSSGVSFADFLGYLRRAETTEAAKSVDVAKELEGMKSGLLHFFDRLPSKQIRENPPDSVKISDIKHLLSSLGEKMTEEEIEDMAREMRQSCRQTDGRVNFEDFVNLLKA